MRYQMFWPLPPPGAFGQPKFGAWFTVGWLLIGLAWLLSVRQVMSNCGISTVWPSYFRTASSTPLYVMPVTLSVQLPPPLVLPVAATYCHDGRLIAGLSEFTIEQTISVDPPAGGVQSSQPTLPGLFLHSGTVRTVFQVHAVEPRTTLFEPSQVTAFTGIATGRTAHQVPWLAPQALCR